MHLLKNKFWGLILGCCSCAIPSLAQNTTSQDKITINDSNNATLAAQDLVGYLGEFLNYITSSLADDGGKLKQIVEDSYTPSKNRIFANEKVIIEDDADPKADFGHANDMTLNIYINNLMLLYEKTHDSSIEFTNITLSKVKKKDYLYIKAKFDENFKSKFKLTGETYPIRHREALIKLSKLATNQWDAQIESITFCDPASPIEGIENNLLIISDESSTAQLISEEDFVKQTENFITAKKAEARARQIVFNEYITSGNDYSAKRQFTEALKMYTRAQEIKALVPFLDRKILDTKRLVADNSFENIKNKAAQAKSERRYDDALRYYKEALVNNPEAHTTLESEIANLGRKLDQISKPKNQLESGKLKEALETCEKILKEHKKERFDYPEIIFLEGLIYQKLAEQTGADNAKLLTKALECFKEAIDKFGNYTDARLARAAFYVKVKHDYALAIADYDAITANTLDFSTEKAQYFVDKGNLKDKNKNPDGALTDYERAIVLNPDLVAAHFQKADLLYRQRQYKEALASFNTVLKLAPKSVNAYYGRGITNFALREVSDAGADFRNAEQLGWPSQQLRRIEAISDSLSVSALKLFKVKQYAAADTLYNNSIAIRECKDKSWFGKAEIKIALAQGLAKETAKSIYQDDLNQAIKLYQKALDCNPAYLEAYFRKGQAYQQLGAFEQALKSYSDAVKREKTYVPAYEGRGSTYLQMKQYSQAIPEYTQACIILKANLESAKKAGIKQTIAATAEELSQDYQFIGQAWYYSTDYAKAIFNLDEALKLNEKYADALYYKGLAYEFSADLSKSQKCYADALKYSHQKAYYYANGRSFLKSQKYEQAVSNFSTVLQLDTAHTLKNTYYLRGLSYFKNKLFDNARKDFEAYAKLETGKKDSIFYSEYGLVNLYLGHDAEAIDNFNHALALNGNNSQAHFGLGCAYAKIGQYDKAVPFFEKAYQTKQLKSSDIKLAEETFLTQLTKDKQYKSQYQQLKKKYIVDG